MLQITYKKNYHGRKNNVAQHFENNKGKRWQSWRLSSSVVTVGLYRRQDGLERTESGHDRFHQQVENEQNPPRRRFILPHWTIIHFHHWSRVQNR